jgi:hypothetical protein
VKRGENGKKGAEKIVGGGWTMDCSKSEGNKNKNKKIVIIKLKILN